jgi:hypothetical protein
MPTLIYDPPPNFYREASAPSESYQSPEVNASLQVYQFRPFSGNLQQQFSRTLLRDWIDPGHQETNVAAPPTFQRETAPGAEAVVVSNFVENVAGMPGPHMRVAVLAHGAVALVDLSANSTYSWQRAWPAMRVVLTSMKVEEAAGDQPPVASGRPGHGGPGIAGVFAGITKRRMSDLIRGPGSFNQVTALHYYVFSPNGQVYRTFEQPKPPGGDVTRFDYRAAARADPDNSGTYTVDGNRIIIRTGGGQPESITGTILDPNSLSINLITYHREP